MQRLTHSLCISLTFVAAFCVAGLTFAAPTPEDPFRPDVTYADGTVTATFLLLQDGQHIYDAMLTCSLGAPGGDASACRDGTHAGGFVAATRCGAEQGGLHPAGRVCRLPARRAAGGDGSVLLG